MSRYIQIDVRLVPVYGAGGMKSAFPRLFDLLQNYGYDLVIQREPTLYEMVEVLIRLRNDPNVPRDAKRPIGERLDEFTRARDQAREMLLSRRLNDLDRLLYSLEDLFGKLEEELG